MAKRINWDNVNKVNKGLSHGFGCVSDELPAIGSYADMRRYCENQGVNVFSDDAFENRLPKPRGKDEPSGPKIIVKKCSSSSFKAKGDSSNFPCSSKKYIKPLTKICNNSLRIKQLEGELVRLVKFISLVNVKKSGSSSCQNLLEKIYCNLEELIKLDPEKAKSPLNPELQKAYDKLRTVVS